MAKDFEIVTRPEQTSKYQDLFDALDATLDSDQAVRLTDSTASNTVFSAIRWHLRKEHMGAELKLRTKAYDGATHVWLERKQKSVTSLPKRELASVRK